MPVSIIQGLELTTLHPNTDSLWEDVFSLQTKTDKVRIEVYLDLDSITQPGIYTMDQLLLCLKDFRKQDKISYLDLETMTRRNHSTHNASHKHPSTLLEASIKFRETLTTLDQGNTIRIKMKDAEFHLEMQNIRIRYKTILDPDPTPLKTALMDLNTSSVVDQTMALKVLDQVQELMISYLQMRVKDTRLRMEEEIKAGQNLGTQVQEPMI